jgi:DNA-binding response OmpR family regulator
MSPDGNRTTERLLLRLIEENLPFLEDLVATSRALAGRQEEAHPVRSPASALGTQPSIFVVVDDGEAHEPMTEFELRHKDWAPCNLLFDTTRNELVVRHRDEGKERRIPLERRETSYRRRRGGSVGKKDSRARVRRSARINAAEAPKIPGGSIFTILRTMMEHPGIRFTERVMARHTGRLCDSKTFAKYIERLRTLLEDSKSRHPLILTDRNVDGSVSKTHSAYYADPESRFRVIRYAAGVSPKYP